MPPLIHRYKSLSCLLLFLMYPLIWAVNDCSLSGWPRKSFVMNFQQKSNPPKLNYSPKLISNIKRTYFLKLLMYSNFEQVGCLQFWCHPVGTNDRTHPMERHECLTGKSTPTNPTTCRRCRSLVVFSWSIVSNGMQYFFPINFLDYVCEGCWSCRLHGPQARYS